MQLIKGCFAVLAAKLFPQYVDRVDRSKYFLISYLRKRFPLFRNTGRLTPVKISGKRSEAKVIRRQAALSTSFPHGLWTEKYPFFKRLRRYCTYPQALLLVLDINTVFYLDSNS